MQIFLVGGAVRDRLLGRAVTDRDWVVVGATPEQMIDLGYQKVGADFPVFLHPETHEEYALARTERKTASGHRGFSTQFSPDVTLEEDLARRDLTINAIAQDEQGGLVDPYGGVADLESKTLRAVTEAFREDPLRILRVARFAAQLNEFLVAEDTVVMMRDMCAHGALNELPGERVWQEFAKVLDAPVPSRFFEVLDDVGGYQPFFSEFADAALPDVRALDALARFAAWCEALSGGEITALCKRIKAPNTFRDFALQVVRYGPTLRNWVNAPALEVARAVQACRGFHDQANIEPLLHYLTLRGAERLGPLQHAVQQANERVRSEDFSQQGAALGAALLQARADLLAQAQRLR